MAAILSQWKGSPLENDFNTEDNGNEGGKAQGSRQHEVLGSSCNNLINLNFSDTGGDRFSLWLYPL